MIVIHVQVKVKPEAESHFLDQARQEVTHARAVEGCVNYAWLEDVSIPQQYVLYEEWESQAQFDAYKGSDFFKHLQTVFMPLMAEPPQSHYYTANALA